ncbi:MAG: peptidylprolyl isomerase [Thermoplasmata archaeon]|nr:MAG: peptidylprolyl isomerase [Thermoplasmata archaeon]
MNNAKAAGIEDEPEPESKPEIVQTAVLDTNWGVIKFELYTELAPITTDNFIKLADEKFYDGIKFHRIIDDFVIQTGDPNTRNDNPYDDGSGGSDQTIPLEIHPDLTHIDGAVGMARSAEEDSASSQFYICDGPQHGLDGDYAVFGITVEGMDVVRDIASAETYPDYRVMLKDHPVDDIVMNQVYIEEFINTTNESAEEIDSESKKDSMPGFQTPFVLSAMAAAAVIVYYKRR